MLAAIASVLGAAPSFTAVATPAAFVDQAGRLLKDKTKSRITKTPTITTPSVDFALRRPLWGR